MINWLALLVGLVIAMVLSIVGGIFRWFSLAFGVLIAGTFVGFMVNRDILNGMIHGILIAITGSLVLVILTIFMGHVSPNIALYVGVVTFGSILSAITMGTIGGAIGSVLNRWI